MNWFDRILPGFIQSATRSNSVPEGLWTKCVQCEELVYTSELKRNLYVCNKCDHHMYISPRERLEALLDENSTQELSANVGTIDILKFKDTKTYRDRIKNAQKSTQEEEAIVLMRGTIQQLPVVVAVLDFKFMGGSMGSVVGEKFVNGVDEAISSNSPYIVFSASGGARMQEALFSLMQMAKTSAALGSLRTAKCPFISVLTNPTMGGVSASFAMLGDINIAEPKALIGFAGQRVIKQTVGETLPEGFQRAEYLLEHGTIDRIVARKDLRYELGVMCKILMNRGS